MTRLFVAVHLPGTLQDTLIGFAADLPGARWVTREQMHLTLRFIGEVDAQLLAAVDAALAAVSRPAFNLTVASVGCFPARGAPRVLWTGLQPQPALIALQQAVEQVVRGAGLPAEPKPFSPHITLARFKTPPPAAALQAWLAGHTNFLAPAFRVRAFHLVASQLSADGARYTTLRSYALNGDFR